MYRYCLPPAQNSYRILYDPNKTGNVLLAVCQKSNDMGRDRAYGTYLYMYIYIYTRLLYTEQKSKSIYDRVWVFIYPYPYIYIYTPILYVMPYIMYGYITNGYDNDRSPDAILGNDTRERAKILTWLIARTRHGPNSIYLLVRIICVYDIIIIIINTTCYLRPGVYFITLTLCVISVYIYYHYYCIVIILTHGRKKKLANDIFFYIIHVIYYMFVWYLYLRTDIIIRVRHIYAFHICNVYVYIKYYIHAKPVFRKLNIMIFLVWYNVMHTRAIEVPSVYHAVGISYLPMEK